GNRSLVGDWSSDVCSSDLGRSTATSSGCARSSESSTKHLTGSNPSTGSAIASERRDTNDFSLCLVMAGLVPAIHVFESVCVQDRSEERRVGKGGEWRL